MSSSRTASSANTPTASRSAPWIASTRVRTCWSSIPTNVSIAVSANPECPAEAIKPDTSKGLDSWLKLNLDMAKSWPNLTKKRAALPEAKEMDGKEGKLEMVFGEPGRGRLSRRIEFWRPRIMSGAREAMPNSRSAPVRSGFSLKDSRDLAFEFFSEIEARVNYWVPSSRAKRQFSVDFQPFP